MCDIRHQRRTDCPARVIHQDTVAHRRLDFHIIKIRDRRSASRSITSHRDPELELPHPHRQSSSGISHRLPARIAISCQRIVNRHRSSRIRARLDHRRSRSQRSRRHHPILKSHLYRLRSRESVVLRKTGIPQRKRLRPKCLIYLKPTRRIPRSPRPHSRSWALLSRSLSKHIHCKGVAGNICGKNIIKIYPPRCRENRILRRGVCIVDRHRHGNSRAEPE